MKKIEPEPIVDALSSYGPSWLVLGVCAAIFCWRFPTLVGKFLTHRRESKKDKREQERLDKKLDLRIEEKRNKVKRVGRGKK